MSKSEGISFEVEFNGKDPTVSHEYMALKDMIDARTGKTIKKGSILKANDNEMDRQFLGFLVTFRGAVAI